MTHCPNCDAEVAEADRFCSNCAHPLSADASAQETEADAASPPKAAPPSPGARGLDDVPTWLGWLAIPIGLTVIGLPIYCVWAYRRGRRDGVGREPKDPPYSSFGWRVTGWSAAAIFLPFIDWYIFVHLPTLCYKHGLRVGAKEDAAPQGFTSVTAVIGAASVAIVGAIAGLTVLVMAVSGEFDSGGDEGYVPGPIATASGPRLTGAEAAGKVEARLRNSVTESGRKDLSYACDFEDYNSVSQKWVVACLVAGPQNAVNYRFTVDDRFGTVSQIE